MKKMKLSLYLLKKQFEHHNFEDIPLINTIKKLLKSHFDTE